MFRIGLSVLVVAALVVTLHAAPEAAAATGTRASPASTQAGAASQKTNQPPAAQTQTASQSVESPNTPNSKQPAAAQPRSVSAPAESAYIPLPAGSTEFNLMQQIRGNLNGFDCSALVSDMKSNSAFAAVTRFNLAESKMSDACAAQVFSLLNKMPELTYLNCHRCAVSTAGAAALALHMRSGTSKIHFIDLIWNDISDSDVQVLADSFDNVPFTVAVYTDHNPKCHNANGILRDCKNHRAEAKRQEAVHAAAIAAEQAREKARETERRAEQIKAAAAAVKQQHKVDKTSAGAL